MQVSGPLLIFGHHMKVHPFGIRFGIGSDAHYSMIFTSRGFSSKDTGYGGIGSLTYHGFFGVGPPRLLMRVSPPRVSKSSHKGHQFGITWRDTSSIGYVWSPFHDTPSVSKQKFRLDIICVTKQKVRLVKFLKNFVKRIGMLPETM